MFALLALLPSHVPTYGGDVENCFKLPHIHTVSQVVYIHGSGGLEIHVEDDTTPFDTQGGELIDFDAVFREEIDQSTYSLYVGCGGCVASQDPLVASSKVELNGYQEVEIEPFTQTAYRSVFPKLNRTFNASLLSAANCDQKHFTIRLVDHLNRTDAKPIVWGAVAGLGEQFTFQELIEFPLYILKNHGETWNEAAWTWWLTYFVFAPLLITTARFLLQALGYSPLDGTPLALRWESGKLRVQMRSVRPRAFFYEIAVLGFTAAALEELIHLILVQAGNPVNWGFWVGIFLVIGFAQILPILFVLLVWSSMNYSDQKLPPAQPARCWASCLACSKPAFWAPLEFFTGFSFLFLLGAGFYVGPAAIMIAALVRLTELQNTDVGNNNYSQVATNHFPAIVMINK